ncbi:MAG TPA: hypothetical protein DCZ01_11915 [Elusimicrobia bacterium]|nr:MAG: hypothetical protein A2X37_09025 [Elusimicrobia bacterium GWA2_66_18]OGR71762.1 MAG: hypothetical protein A2X40_05400 [Elusimicrobia bacterium GWC2_65_9]HAZ09196.1 hypothetical protein [Elusimicrobiota bacterium]
MPKHRFQISVPVAIFITLAAIIYQRTTGPTYPKKVIIEAAGNRIKIPLPRSHESETNAPVLIPILETGMSGRLLFRRYPTDDPWTERPLRPDGNQLVGELPSQPPAGKLQYYVSIHTSEKEQMLAGPEAPIVIRFKGAVPTAILAPHIIFMFFSMLLSALAGVEALFRTRIYFKISMLTTGCLFLGGMVLGPIVQKYAFGAYWAGFPYGYDLTDNKLLICVIFWAIALILNREKARPQWVTVAAVVLLIMYTIPHSTMGSQYNYHKGQIETAR